MNPRTHSALLLPCSALVCAALVVVSTANAQTTSSTPTPADPATARSLPSKEEVAAEAPVAEEDVVELSPFEVNGEADRGYQALSTLGGTRLRTDLRDVAASISVVTKQLMEDLASTDWTVLANYTMGTEVGGMSGNYSDSFMAGGGFQNFDDTRRALTPNVRLRGLSPATRTRDYFLTNIPGESYNIERMEIQRGPNGMLYGLGSPSGVLNDGLIRATPLRNKSLISVSADSFGGYRGSIDHNQVLIKDELAFRVAALGKTDKYQIEDAYNRERRFYGTLTYKPFKDSTLRVSGETAEVRANPPRTTPPFDMFSYWWDYGMPTYNGYTGTYSVLGTLPTGPGWTGNPNQLAVNFAHRATQPYFVVEDPTTGDFGLSIPGNPVAMEMAATRLYRNDANTGWRNGDMVGMQQMREYLRLSARAAKGGVDSDYNFYRFQQISDPGIFNFFEQQLDGPSRHRDGRWKNYNITFEQRLGRHAGIEVAYDHQYVDEMFRDTVQFNRYGLTLDVTTVLPTGDPNPNYGRLFFTDAYFSGVTNRLRDAYRATAYYDLDFKDIMPQDNLLRRILGRHTLTANYTDQDEEVYSPYGGEMYDMAYYNMVQSQNAGTTTVARVTSNGQRQTGTIVYTGPNIASLSGPLAGIRAQPLGRSLMPRDRGINSIDLYYHQTPTAASTTPIPYTTGRFNIINMGEWELDQVAYGGSYRYSDFEAVSAVLQDRWLNDHLITTFGWRRDQVETYDAGAMTFDSTGRPNLDAWTLKKQLEQDHTSFNYGIVLHLPEFITKYIPSQPDISLSYNNSDNFTPQSQRINVFGANIDPTKGTTEEYGITVSLFDRKVDLRIVSYETASALSTNSGFNATIIDFDRTMYRTVASIEAGEFDTRTEPVSREIQDALVQVVRSPEYARFANMEVTGWYVDSNNHLQGTESGSSGRVFETSDTVAKGTEYELTANLTRNWRLTANANRQESVLSNSGNDLWSAIQSWRPLFVGTTAGQMPWTVGGNETWETKFLVNEASVRRVRDLDGSASPEVREWRFNVMTNYSFSEGRLAGWGVGGAVRWQDDVAIGYATKFDQNNVAIFDVTKPYYGPSETNFDAWISFRRKIWQDKVNMRVQLNARNIGQHHKLIPVGSQPTGAVASWRIATDASYVLSTTFEF